MLGTWRKGTATARRRVPSRIRPGLFALLVGSGTAGSLLGTACGKDAPATPVPGESEAGGAGDSGAGGAIDVGSGSSTAGGSIGGANVGGSSGNDALGGGGSCDGSCSEDATGWSKPMLLEEHDGKAFANPRVGTDASGNVLVAWDRDSPSRGSVWVNVYEANAGAWRGAMDLMGGDIGEPTGDPVVAFGPGQTAHVLYRYQLAGSGQTRALRVNTLSFAPYDWSLKQLDANLATENSHPGFALAIDQNSHGRVGAAYRSVGRERHVSVLRYDPVGHNWLARETIGPITGDYSSTPKVTVSESGSTTLLWHHYVPGDYTVYAQTHTLSSGWGELHTLDQGDKANVVGVDYGTTGEGLGAWVRRTNAADPQSFMVSSVDAETGTWSSPAVLNDPGDSVVTGAVQLDDEGNAFCVWVAADLNEDHLDARRYDRVARQWSPVKEIARGGRMRLPQLGTDAQGNAVALWRQVDDDTDRVYSVRYDGSHRWSEPIALDTEPGEIGGLDAVVAPNGTAYAVWHQEANGMGSIWFSQEDPQK